MQRKRKAEQRKLAMASIKQRNERYNKYVDSVSPKTSAATSLWNSFWIGGLTCMIGQGLALLFALLFPNFSEELIANITSMTLISVAIIFTGFGFYDVIAKKGGAGSFLPITGFANAMSSASMEFKSEGLIMGTSVKLFSVVGPVIVNGIVWSSAAGLIRLLISAIGGM
jgi:stage V sporulation protein AC